MVIKECEHCGKEFDAKGRTLTCSKECSKKYKKEKDKQYYRDNKEKIKKQRGQYYRDNKEKILEQYRQYRQKNREKIREQKRQYYQDNKEKVKEQIRQYRQKNKEKVKEWNRQYRQKNKEKIKEKYKQYYQDNKEKENERCRQYYQDNKEYFKQYQKKKYEQAYKKLSKKYDISVEDLKSYLPLSIVQRELECFDQGSYFLDLLIPAHERANGKCEITGKKTNDLVVHHLNGYNWCIEGRMDLDNVIVICEELHIAFHKKYGYGDNTEEQFWKFVEEWEKGLVTLDDFMEDQ